MSTESFGVADELIEINIAGSDKHGVVRGISTFEIVGHLIARQCRDRRRRTEHAMCERVTDVQVFHHRFVPNPKRLIGVHRNFFEDHALFFVEVFRAKCWAQNVRKNLENRACAFRQHMRVVGREFVGGERIVVRAEIIEVAIDLFRATMLASLEHHVFKKV